MLFCCFMIGHGRITLKVLPEPGVLSTTASPPWNWEISFTIAKPRPLLPSSPREVSAC